MNYKHLPFEEYFINTSEDYTHTGQVTYPVKYTAVKYNLTKIGKLFLLVLKILPFASMCADRFGKKESTS